MHDIIIVGLGAMGSAAARELATRGARVLGIDRWSPPHTMGSTHGRTRIIREAYFEHPLYVPLVRRAYEKWAELERLAGETLFVPTGGLMIGPPEGALVAGALASAREHDVAHELLGREAMRERHPDFALEPGWVALLERRAGILFPERCVEACLTSARAHGAELRTGETVLGWEAGDGGVRVRTDRGTHEGARLVLAAGAWMPGLIGDLAPLTVERQTFHWFAPREGHPPFGPGRTPIALWEYAPGRMFATFPDFGDGLKAGVHHEGEITTPDAVRRETTPDEDASVTALLAHVLPGAAGALRETRVCLYTDTPDDHFVIDRHPAHPNVLVASPCSGHGFKFASAIGEVLADLALDEAPRFDLSPFALERFRVARA